MNKELANWVTKEAENFANPNHLAKDDVRSPVWNLIQHHKESFIAGAQAIYDHLLKSSGELPECPSYVAHPQAVWFECHWRPMIAARDAEIAKLKASEDELIEECAGMSEAICVLERRIKELESK